MSANYDRRTKVGGGRMGIISLERDYLSYTRPVTMSPRFQGKDVDAAIAIGRHELETVLRQIAREVPSFKAAIKVEWASISGIDGFQVSCEAPWMAGKERAQVLAAFQKNADRFGYGLDAPLSPANL